MQRKLAIFLILILGGLSLQPAQADRDERDERRERRQNREELRIERVEGRLSPGEAARRAQHRNGGGRVLDVNPMTEGYRVKLLKEGEVRMLFVPDGP